MYYKLIPLPLKSTEHMDFFQPGIKNYLMANYGSLKDFQPDFLKLNKIRNDTINDIKNDWRLLRKMYLQYLNHLESLELRIPSNLIEFKWSEAKNNDDALIVDETISFEKANLLFNLAAINTKLAIELAHNDKKSAIECFSNAIGIFDFIQQHFVNAPIEDLKSDSLTVFRNLMCAEAQEAFIINYLDTSKVKETLLAKLALSAGYYYQHVVSAIDKFLDEETCLDDKSNLINLKYKYYYSLANYYQAIHHKDSNEFGLAIVFLRRSLDDLKDYKKYYERSTFYDMLIEHLALVENNLNALEKDNDLIYHDLIPTIITDIKKMDAFKAVPFEKQKLPISEDEEDMLFTNLVPFKVHEKLSIYSGMTDNLLRTQTESNQVANEEFDSTLEFLNLPRSLIELKDLVNDKKEEEDIDARVLAVASEMNQFPLSHKESDETRSQTKDILDRCDKLIDESPFAPSLRRFKEEVSALKNSLSTAAETDAKLQMTYKKYKPEIELLSGGPANQALLETFNSGNDITSSLTQQVSLLDLDDSTGDMSSSKAKIDQIDERLQELRYLKKERLNTVSDLKEQVLREDDISTKLILAGLKTEDEHVAFFNEQIQKFKPYQDRIQKTITKQSSLISELKILMNSVINDPVIKKKSEDRNKSIHNGNALVIKYLDCYENWKSVKSGLSQATKFYGKAFNMSNELQLKIQKAISQLQQQQYQQQYIQQQQQQQQASTPAYQPYQSYQYGYQPSFQQQQSVYEAAPPTYNASVTSSSQRSSFTGMPSSQHSSLSGMAGGPPPLPSKPSQPPQASPHSSTGDIYSTPSVYDPSLYSRFGSQGQAPNQNQNQNWKY